MGVRRKCKELREQYRTHEQYQGILGAGSIILNILFLRETREDVLLSRRAKRLTKQTGRKHICASDLQTRSFFTTLRVSLVRPFGTWFKCDADTADITSVSRYGAYCDCSCRMGRLCLELPVPVCRIYPSRVQAIQLEHRSTGIHPSVSVTRSAS